MYTDPRLQLLTAGLDVVSAERAPLSLDLSNAMSLTFKVDVVAARQKILND